MLCVGVGTVAEVLVSTDYLPATLFFTDFVVLTGGLRVVQR